ncbi:MAG: hypothetical protein LBU38_01985 [Propionibacteriaceae bacterium]|nr:hypothetical protein [Propionibacteriaceae bacterium]
MALVIAADVVALFSPVYSNGDSLWASYADSGRNNLGAILPFMVVPLILVIVPLLAGALSGGRGEIEVAALVCGFLLLGGCFLAIVTVGLWFLPAAFAMIASALFPGERREKVKPHCDS